MPRCMHNIDCCQQSKAICVAFLRQVIARQIQYALCTTVLSSCTKMFCHKIPTHYGDATFPNVLFRRSDKDLGRVTPATEQLTQSSAHFSVCDSSWSNSARNGFNTFLTTTVTCFWRTGPLTSVKVIGKRLTPIMGLAKYKVIPLHYQNQTPVPNDIKCLYHKEDGHHLNYRYLPWKLQAKKYKRRKISSFAQDAANLQPSF